MNRRALPGRKDLDGGKKSSVRDPKGTPKVSAKTKVDPLYANTDEQSIVGPEFSADEDNPEEEEFERLKREFEQRSSKYNELQVRGKGNAQLKKSDEDESEERNKPIDNKISQQPQQDEIVFTTAFKWQLVTVVVLVVLSLLAHYCLCTYLLHNVHVSDIMSSKSQGNYDTKISDIDYKVDKAIKNKLHQTDIDKEVKNALESELNSVDISHEVKVIIDKHLSPADIDKKVDVSLKPKVSDIVLKVETIKTDLKRLESNQNKTIEEIEKFLERLNELQGKIENNTQELNKLTERIELSDQYTKIVAKVKDDLKITDLQVSIEEGNKTLARIDKEFKKVEARLVGALKEYEGYNERIQKIKEELAIIQPNTFNKESFMLAFMTLTVIVCLLAVAVFNMYQRGQGTVSPHLEGGTHARQNLKNMGNNAILQKLPDSPVLPPGVCIISYNEARIECHRKLLESSNIPKCDVKSYVIRSHEDIVNLPRYKVYIMCIEFSERHVIIEEPGMGLGDLHRTTYYAVKKFGGGLIILYTKDPGSRKLKSPENPALYNADIYCVQKQPELIALEQNDEFYSIYDELSDHQKSKLRQRIEHYMT